MKFKNRPEKDKAIKIITSGKVDKYEYTLNFNPKLWIPAGVKNVD